MEQLVTLAVFDNAFDVKFNLLKDMLYQAGIAYFINNENSRSIHPMPAMTPTNVSIDVKVYSGKLEEAVSILKSIV
jgi:hypothetical protein